MQFSGKSVIITGAGKGIGRACAILMAARGAEVVAISRTQSDLDSLKSEIGGRSIRVDLADVASTRAAMVEAGPCDFLINSAGINVLESVLDMSDEGYEAVLGINLRAALVTCRGNSPVPVSQRVAAAQSSTSRQLPVIAVFRIISATRPRKRGLKAQPAFLPGTRAARHPCQRRGADHHAD